MGSKRLALAALALSLGCGPLGPKPGEAEPEGLRAKIVTTERGPRGGHLILLKEDGTRLADLTRGGAELTVDSHPAFSPRGDFLVFTSTRGHARLGRTSLWLIEASSRSEPRPLLTRASVDRDPVWVSDGDGIVFSSNEGGSFDLWLLELERAEDGWPRARGEPIRLTDAGTDELSPAVSPDGAALVYMAVDEDQRSTLWRVDLEGGTPQKITDGPADLTPSFSPDGRTIAFAGPVKGRGDTDLHAVNADGGDRRILVEEPYSDQTGPVWSGDGRYVFSTSVYRSVADGSPVLSSVVVLDVGEGTPTLRALHDPVVVESRIGVAVAPVELDGRLLRANPPYLPALKQAIRKLWRERQFEAERPAER